MEIFRSLQKSLPVIVIALISTAEMTTRLYLPLALGAKGVISVLSNIEALLESLTSDINPVPVKTAMNMMGLSVGSCRLPLCPMDGFLLSNS